VAIYHLLCLFIVALAQSNPFFVMSMDAVFREIFANFNCCWYPSFQWYNCELYERLWWGFCCSVRCIPV